MMQKTPRKERIKSFAISNSGMYNIVTEAMLEIDQIIIVKTHMISVLLNLFFTALLINRN